MKVALYFLVLGDKNSSSAAFIYPDRKLYVKVTLPSV